MDNLDFAHAERSALDQFKRRVAEISAEVAEIDRELSRRDILALSHRTQRSIRSTRSLLDRNVDILFAGQQGEVHGDLYVQLEYAEGHIAAALSTEVEFQAMEQRLYLAARLAEDVLAQLLVAVEAMQGRIESGTLLPETAV